MYRLFAYADCSDLAAHEETLVRAFTEFVAEWQLPDVLLTNKKAPLTAGQVLPDWNIGMRVSTTELTRGHVEQLLSFLVALSRQVNLPFVIGTWRHRAVGTTDLCIIDRLVPDGAASAILTGAKES